MIQILGTDFLKISTDLLLRLLMWELWQPVFQQQRVSALERWRHSLLVEKRSSAFSPPRKFQKEDPKDP